MAISVCTTMFFLILVISNTNCGTFNNALIKDFLQWKNIKVALYFVCELSTWTEHDNTVKNLRNRNIQFGVWDMSKESNLSNFDYETFLLRTGYPFCVIIDWECPSTPTILGEMSKRKMFHYERFWLMFGTDVDAMFSALSLESINIDAEVTIAVSSAGDQNGMPDFEIYDVYNPSCRRNGRFEMELSANWTHSTGLFVNNKSSKFDRRHNIGGTTFKSEITIPKLPPNKTLMEHINSDDFTFIDTKERGNYRVYEILASMFNFKLVIRRGKIWAALKPNGFWFGVVGSLNRSEIDLSITTLRWENDRYGAFDQTTDTFYVNNVFIFRHPRSVDSVTVFLTPFDGIVWLSIVAFGIVFSGFVRKLLFTSTNELKYNSSTEDDCSYGDGFLMVFGFLFQQGYATNASFTSSRIFVLSHLLFALLIYQFYSSFIVGSLLTETPKTIKTMKQLLHSRLDLAMDELPYVQDILHYNTEESAVQMYNKIMAQTTPFLSLHKGLDLVKSGSLAFDTDGVNAYPILKTLLTDREICDLQEVRVVAKFPAGPGLPKKSPLRELIKIGIRKIYETGTLSHIWSFWVARLPKCSHSDVDIDPIDLTHFSSALIVLSFGMYMSIVILLVELLHKNMMRRQLIREKNCAELGTQLKNWS